MKRVLLWLIVLCLLFGTACQGISGSSIEGETIKFTDSCGRTVELPATIQKVAPSGSVAQMILYTLAPDVLVGWSSLPNSSQLKYFPQKYWSMPTFGQFYGSKANLNLEALMDAKPQVIIDLGDMKEGHAADMDSIQDQTGIPTIFIETSFYNIANAYRTLGKLLNCSERAEELACYIEETVKDAEQRAARIPEAERVTVMYGSGASGLNCNARGSTQADVIELVGAVNAIVVEFISNKGGGNTISMEQLMVFDPDVILLTAEAPFDGLETDSQWQGLRAVREGRYYQVPQLPYCWLSNPPSVNRILGVRWLGNLLYPDQFDYDMYAEVKRYFGTTA